MSKSLSFRLQLGSIMEVMTNTAIEQICKIVDSDFAFLRQEVSRVMSENTVLKDKMLSLGGERQDEGTRITKEEARAASRTRRSVCVQTEDGAEPSIKGIFGKEWCSSLWDRRNESTEDELAIDVDLYTTSPYKHKEQEHPNLVIIKEESFEVDTYPSYTETSEIQNTSSESSEKLSTEDAVEDTVDQLIAPIDDPLEFDAQSILNQFSGEHNGQFLSEAQDDEEAQEIYTAATADHRRKRFRVHRVPSTRNFSYYDGGKVFHRQNAGKNHLRKHRLPRIKPNERFRCEICGKCFHSQTNLSVHYLVHTGEKPYKCSFCGKAFSQKGNLQAHERIHKGERPFSCGVCGRSFTQKVCLRNHERIHRGERPFSCMTCGKCFTQKVTLKQHLTIHDESAKTVRRRPKKNHSNDDLNYVALSI